MKIKKCLIVFCSLLLLLFNSCNKEEFGNSIILKAEGFTSPQKAAVEGKFTYWLENDKVLINNNTYVVNLETEYDAMIHDVATVANHTYYAVYPASVYVNNSGSLYTVNIPKTHHYKEQNGRQVLDKLPMIAYYTGNSDPSYLHFKHLTAALTLHIKNEKSETLEIDKVEIINNKYQLSGNIQVDISQCSDQTGITITPNKTNVADTVSVYFSDIKKQIASNSYLDVQVPILPVGSDNSDFTIKVYAHYTGTRYIYNRSTGERNNAVPRAGLGYVVTKYSVDVPGTDLFDSHTENGINYFEIWTPDDMFRVAEALENLWETPNGEPYNFGNYMVMDNINMDGTVITPLYNYNLNGTNRCYFEGKNHTISNMTISSIEGNEKNCCSFFGKSIGDNITVSNLNLTNMNYEFSHTANYLINYDNNPSSAVGGLFSVVSQEGIIVENCNISHIKVGSTNSISGVSSQTDLYVGGIVGLVNSEIEIRNSSVTEITIDNEKDDIPGNTLVDQFGGAIGRIDVGDRNGSNSYQYLGYNAPATVIENFTYNQGSEPLVFKEGLRNVRYGGIVANITRGGIVSLINCKAIHNVVVYKPTQQMYCAGLIGCNRVAQLMGIYLDPNCEISGTIDNQAVTSYNGSFQVEKYVGNTTNKISLLSGSANTCVYSLTVTGKTSTFKSPNQHL